MAKPKRKFAIRFELGIGGLLGLGVLVFCIFLWMFLLGIWAGQTVLSPTSADNKINAMTRLAADIWQKGKQLAPDDGLTGRQSAAKENSFFSLQIGAFRDPAKAAAMVKKWRKRGYTVFAIAGDADDDSLNRVFIGKYKNLAAANTKAAALEDSDNIRAYITLLPEAAFNKSTLKK
jgi:hypothetical protein